MYLKRANFLFRQITHNALIWQKPALEPTLYLTFDDGPVPGVTNRVLAILKERNILATFFCVGDNIEKQPALFEMVKQHGHQIGNHTYSHINGWKSKSDEHFYSDIERCNRLTKSQLFRPPHGRIKRRQVRFLKKKYTLYMWSLLTADFDKSITPKQCLNNALQARSGDIIVFHDSEKAAENMLYALPLFLDHFIEKGFTFEILK